MVNNSMSLFCSHIIVGDIQVTASWIKYFSFDVSRKMSLNKGKFFVE